MKILILLLLFTEPRPKSYSIVFSFKLDKTVQFNSSDAVKYIFQAEMCSKYWFMIVYRDTNKNTQQELIADNN